MSQQITIEVSGRVLRHAAQVAAQTHRSIADVLATWLEEVTTERSVEELPDEEVLPLTELCLTAEQETALSDLLEQNREGTLGAEGQRKLDELRQRVREAAGERCGYCLSPQPLVMGKLEIEHIIPRAGGGSDEESNLWLSCGLCHRYKGAQVEAVDPRAGKAVTLYNPRSDNWHEHFSWSADGAKIIGVTSVGHATIVALNLNNEVAVEVCRNWILAGWHPPKS